MTVPMPSSNDVVGASTDAPAQSKNDIAENATPSVVPLSASTDTPTPTDTHPIASETPKADELVLKTYRQVGNNGITSLTFDDIVAMQQRDKATPKADDGRTEQTPPESGAKPAPARPTTPRRPRTPAQPKPTPPPIVLSEQEQAFYDLYCSLPWIKIAPEITLKVKDLCAKLAPHLTTYEQMDSLKKFMNKKEFFKGKGFNLPLVAMAINDWAMTQEMIDLKSERNGAHKNTAVHAGSTITTPDPEKEASIQKAKDALARLQEQRANQQAAARLGA